MNTKGVILTDQLQQKLINILVMNTDICNWSKVRIIYDSLIHSQYAYFSEYISFYDLSTDDYNEFKLKLFVIFVTRVMYDAFTVIGDAYNSINNTFFSFSLKRHP